MIAPVSARRALFASIAALLLTGCSSSDPGPSRYELCLAHGGDYEYDGWSGDYECDLPPRSAS